MISVQYLLKIFEENADDLDPVCRRLVVEQDDQRFKTTVSVIDCLIMYFMIIDRRPKTIIEFSPYRGYSTCFIAAAARKIDVKFTTFDISSVVVKKFLDPNLRRHGLQDNVDVVVGDAFKTIPRYLKDHGWVPEFAFVDCEHSKATSNKYTKEIFPLLDPAATICIHDITAVKRDQHDGFNTNVKGKIHDEYKGVSDWTKRKKVVYSLTHALLGGKFERSKNLPVNDEFYSKASDILGLDCKPTKRASILLIATNKH